MRFTEKAYAKVNLSLNVFSKRDDGFHEVSTIMVPLDIYDELTFEDNKTFEFNSNIYYENDICLKIYKLMNDKYHFDYGVKVTVKKNIPSEAGLAGGSSDAAAMVRGLSKFYNLNLSLDEMYEFTNKVGSDVAYCVSSVPSICTGRGEIVRPLELSNDVMLDVLLIKPPFGASTGAVYKAYKPSNIKYNDKDNNIIKALNTNDVRLLEENIYNDLYEPCMMVCDEEKELFKELENLNVKAFLSGSGTTIYTFDINNQNLKKFIENHKEFNYIQTKIKYNTKN